MKRRYDLDWLRVIAFYLLIFYHTGLIFVSWDFPVNNNETSTLLEPFMLFLNQWRLPLLFFISGAVIKFSLGKRKPHQFIIERHNRLLIPLIFGMFFIIPPQIYFEHLQNGITYANYGEFYSTVKDMVPYPEGSFSWHHLWYIVYIFVYCVICLPIFLLIRSPKGQIVMEKIGKFMNKTYKLYLPVIILVIIHVTLRERWPENPRNLVSDWYNFAYYLAIFLFGYITCSIDSIWDTIEKGRRKTLILSILSFASLLFIWRPIVDIPWNHTVYKIVEAIVIALNIWGWILSIIGYGKKYLNKPGKLLSYANTSVYPFYILHQTVLVIFGYYVVQLELPIAVKLIGLCIITFVVSLLLYELIIKRTMVTRVLFGMKARNKNKEMKKKEVSLVTAEK